MKPIKRKLVLNAQTLRHLSTEELGRALGGFSSAKATLCSTWEDTGCYPTVANNCGTLECPTDDQACTSRC